jgi:hypothetical protein
MAAAARVNLSSVPELPRALSNGPKESRGRLSAKQTRTGRFPSERPSTLRHRLDRHCMSSEHFGQLAWQFKRVSGSSGLKVQAAIAC